MEKKLIEIKEYRSKEQINRDNIFMTDFLDKN